MEKLNNEEQVVLVDEQNEVLGYMGKHEAHVKGLLHRAISVLIFNSNGEQLVQQRSLTKYHWAGIWSNTCCSHPRKGESFQEAAERRLYEELGFKTELKESFHFIYKAHDEKSGLTEWEYDTVFTGVYDQPFEFNREEINAIRWMQTEELAQDIKENPESYSFWFKIILKEMRNRSIL